MFDKEILAAAKKFTTPQDQSGTIRQRLIRVKANAGFVLKQRPTQLAGGRLLDVKTMRIIVTLIFLFSGLQAHANVSGSISCVVKSNTVISISEGVTKKYTGFEDRFEVGDKLIFEYSAYRLRLDRPTKFLYCSLEDKIRNDEAMGAMHSTGFDPKYDAKIYSNGLEVTSKNSVGENIGFGEDLIICEGVGGDLLLRRYYKSDYEGIFTSSPAPIDLTAQVVTFDCRTIENNIQKVIDLFVDK